MARTPAELFAYLDALGIAHTTVEHEAVFTVEQAKAVRGAHGLAGMHLKNLLLRNKKGKMWLVVAEEDRRVDLKELAARLGAGNLSFASAERLRAHLGVEPGAVTPLALVNDEGHLVEVALDAAIAAADVVHCHPLVNTMTTALGAADLLAFVRATGHEPRLIDLL
jgi:Ala-tRNA(Pro) deacylase